METVVYTGADVVPLFDLPALPGESAHIWYICGNDDAHMLMGHNAKHANIGFLGGLRESDEGVVDAALREFQEETAGIWPFSHVQQLMVECLNSKRFFCRVSNTRRYHFILKDRSTISVNALSAAMGEKLDPMTEEEKKQRGHECDRLVKVEMEALLRGGDAVPGLREVCKAPLAYYAAHRSAFSA